jgi:hypothetical protein
MPKNVYSGINLHIAWHAKNNDPVLVEIVEACLHHYLRHRALETAGVRVHSARRATSFPYSPHLTVHGIAPLNRTRPVGEPRDTRTARKERVQAFHTGNEGATFIDGCGWLVVACGS